jgi:phosphate starvation-inducible PhoH-like protein
MSLNKKLKKYNVEETEQDKIRARKDEIRKKIGKPYLKINAKTENQEKFIKEILDKESMYVIATGIAGAGKTFIALIQAINLLLSYDNEYTKIRIFKPLKQLQGEDIGILPGGVEEKLEYVLMSYSMQLNKLLSPIALEILFKEKIIEVIPMGNLRGLSLDNINIFDEFQNVSVDNAETVLTRLEEGGKMIIIGDIRQRDFKDKTDNGLMILKILMTILKLLNL